MTKQHTPGPWEFITDGNRSIYAGGQTIMSSTKYYPWCPDREADWHLIAAAPDLLASLVSVHRELRKSGWDMTQINAALNKAGIPSGEAS